MIRPNLTRSIALQRRAIEQLQAPQDPENLKAIAQVLHGAYVLTRASHVAVIHMRRQRESHGSVDPILKMQDQTLSASRTHILRASHGLKDGRAERLEKINGRIENLEEAIRHIQRVLGTVP